MKQVIYLSIVLVFASCTMHKPWSDTDKQKFTSKCMEPFKNSGQDSIAKKFCDCELTKLSQKYSGFDDAEKKVTVQEEKELKLACAKEANPSDSSWTGATKDKFYKNIFESVVTNMGEENAKKYLDCVWGKLKLKFGSPAELDLFGTEDIGKQLGAECMKELNLTTSVNNWTSKDDEDFITSCVDAAKGLPDPEKYCNCMLGKIKQQYPNKADAEKISTDTFNTPYWQEIVKGCKEN